MTASLLTALDSIPGLTFLLGWTALSLSLAGLWLGLASYYRRKRRRRALDLELPGHTRIGIDRRSP